MGAKEASANAHKIHIVFGELAARHIADGRITEEVLDDFREFEFASQDLADAFVQGVEAASGYLGHHILTDTDPDLQKIKRKIARQQRTQ